MRENHKKTILLHGTANEMRRVDDRSERREGRIFPIPGGESENTRRTMAMKNMNLNSECFPFLGLRNEHENKGSTTRQTELMLRRCLRDFPRVSRECNRDIKFRFVSFAIGRDPFDCFRQLRDRTLDH